jgi:hypothetical protein
LRYALTRKTRISARQARKPMLPNVRLVLATTAAALLVVSLGVGLLSASRTVFPIGLRSAKGSPIERALPEPPDWKQFVALSAARRAEELNRLIELPGSLPDAPAPGKIERGSEAAAEPAASAAPAVRQ